jgi:hypothetical protein
MPYLSKKRKDELENPKLLYTTAGDLTYGLTLVLRDTTRIRELYILLSQEIERYGTKRPESFAEYAIILGSLDAAKREISRRYAQCEYHPGSDLFFEELLKQYDFFVHDFYQKYVGYYEDKKIQENGDVF